MVEKVLTRREDVFPGVDDGKGHYRVTEIHQSLQSDIVATARKREMERGGREGVREKGNSNDSICTYM